jgi:hypothetical protein
MNSEGYGKIGGHKDSVDHHTIPYMPIGYLIEKALQQPWLRPVPRELQESQRWDVMRLAPVEAGRNTNTAVVPLAHCIDPIACNGVTPGASDC